MRNLLLLLGISICCWSIAISGCSPSDFAEPEAPETTSTTSETGDTGESAATTAESPGSPSESQQETAGAQPSDQETASGASEEPETRAGKVTAEPQETATNEQQKALDEASALLRKAIEAAQQGDFGAAVEAVREAVNKRPDEPQLKLLLAQLIFVRARQLLAEAGEDKEKLSEGAKLAQEATDLAREQVQASTKEDPLRLQKEDLLQSALVFNALAQTRQNQPDAAKELLREAVRAGFTNVELLEEDTELADLKTLPQFQELMQELRELASQQITEQVKALMEVTEPFPFDFEVTDINGQTLRLADLKGKIVLVDFWGTWCPPCRAAIPHLVQLYNEYHDKGLEIIGLAYEQADSPEEAAALVKQFAEQESVPYPLALGTEAIQEQVPGFRGYPTVVLLDRNGQVRLVLVGYRPYEFYKAAVELLLNEQPDQQPAQDAAEPEQAPADQQSMAPARIRTLAQVGAPSGDSGEENAKQGDGDGDSAQELIARAQQLARQGKIEQAVRLARKAHEMNPDDAETTTFLARGLFSYASLLARQNKHLQAARQFDQAAELMKELATNGNLETLQKNILTLGLLSAAREYVQIKKKQVATQRLLESLDLGFTQIDLLESDPYLRQLLEEEKVKDRLKALREARAKELRQQALAELKKGVTFPFDFELPDLNGKIVKLADFKGKVLIVDIWGTWCPPCRREVPHFVELHKKYRDRGLEIVGINFERVPEDQIIPTIRKFVEETGVTYTCVVGRREILTQVPGFRGYPTTLFIDRTGTVRAMVVGYRPLEFLEALVQALLAEEASASRAEATDRVIE